jgi:hypothetical protein
MFSDIKHATNAAYYMVFGNISFWRNSEAFGMISCWRNRASINIAYSDEACL